MSCHPKPILADLQLRHWLPTTAEASIGAAGAGGAVSKAP